MKPPRFVDELPDARQTAAKNTFLMNKVVS